MSRTMSKRDGSPGLVLNGLDGSNPLAFLAAVGTLRTATLAEPNSDWRMKWVERHGTWVPELSAARAISPKALVELLMPALHLESTPEFDFDKNLAVSPEKFEKVAKDAQRRASREARRYADFIASFGCEALVTPDGKKIQDTALRTMSGAGHQHFLGTMKKLVKVTGKRHLHQSLFETWSYEDDMLGLRWDPREDRRYALRWDNPSGDGVKTMRGANRLAVEALPLLPTIPVGRPMGRQLATTGFTRHDRAVWFKWPIWERSLGLDVVRSLLALAEVQAPEPDRTRLRVRGIVEMYRSQRIANDRYINFSHADPA